MDWKARIPALVLWFALVFSSIEDGNAEQRVVCYYTNWSVYRPGTAKFSPQNINPYLCTHLIYAFGGFTKDNTLKPFDKYQDIEKGGYAKFTGLKTYNKNLKTMLAIGGWNEGSSRFSPMVADPGRRKEFVKNSVKFLRQNHFDGLDLDWEYPAFRDGGKPRDRDNYADLVQELREEYERESSKTGRPRLLLSMAVPAGIEYIDKGYDIPRLNDYLDFINLLSYDYHSAFEPAVNHHSPLYPLEEDNEYNYDAELTIDYTIAHLLKGGASSEKIVLGIPTYGRSYTLINEDATDIGAPADGPGEEGDATREKGYLAYYEICENIAKSEEWEVVQPNPSAMGPYAFRQNQWVGYDDEDIVRAKARYVIEKKLGGIMFWSIDNDDFRGKCHGRPYPLIEAAKEALLAGNERSNSGQKTKLSDNRKKTRTQGGQRTQGNSIGRKLGAVNRRTTTQAPSPRRKVSSSRSNARSNARSNVRRTSNEEDDEEGDETEANAVKTVEKPRPRIRSKGQSKNRVSNAGRRKQQNSRQSEESDSANEASLSNSFTTPEPPTTPDPGSDFKCEDEGFFSHPRDCKKYFWCLDSGPGGLGIVGHQFTCPSGLVFNKAADSCDYPRNVVCPKKNAQSAVTTTKAPVTTRAPLPKPAKRTTTPKPEVEEEEYEYYDDEEEDSEEAEPSTTTSKPLQYKTINRSRPTTTTSAPSTTTTETAIEASTKSYKTTPDRLASFEDEEDPRVLKELIDLIKKAGGIEQLEKQLHYQEKNSGGNADKNESNGKSTPATISRSLYERVLSRQATRIAGSFLGSLSTTQSTNGDKAEERPTKNSRTGFVNGPGGAQFEGLDNVPEVKSLRRTNKPKYVTIERHRPSTSESPAEKDEEDEEEDDDDNTDVASSEDRAVSNPPQQRNTNRRVTPSYVNIRRPRPSTTTSENDVEVKDEDTNQDPEDEEEEPVTQRHRIVKTEVESTGPKSRYTNINRFRSTTSRNNEVDQTDEISEKNEITTESTTTTTTTTTTEKVIPVTEEDEETPLPPTTTTLEPSTTSESFSSSTLEQSSTSVEPSTESSTVSLTTDTPLKLVEESATEILFTTVPASSSSPGSSTEPFTRGPSIAAVAQPRPFGFPRRGRPTASTPTSTSSVASVTEQSRPKVVSETLRLPTLKELVGYSTVVTESIADLTSTFAPSTKTFVNITIDNKALQNEHVDRTVSKNQQHNLILDEDNGADDTDTLEVVSSRDKELFDNDVLGSEEVQQRSYSSSFAATATDETQHTRSSEEGGVINNSNQSIKRVEVPVKILDDTDGEEIGELVLLRLPESKLNSAILKPVFRVKILEQDLEGEHKDIKRSDILPGPVSVESSSENELSDNRRRPSRRRRIRINSAQASPTFATLTNESVGRIGERSRPRSRQRIVKARRRTRVNEIPLDRSGEWILNSQETERSDRVQGGISRRGDSVNNKLENVTSTSAYPAETLTTTIRVTTIRGNLPTSSKPSNGTRGFYITRSSDEIATPIPDAITKDPSIDSTEYSLTTSGDVIDESTRRTNFATQSHETLMPQVDRIYPTTEESSTYESIGTTFGELETTTSVADEIDSLGDLLRSTSDKYETMPPDYLSTIEDRLTDSITAMIMTTTEEEAIEQPSITTFRPFTTREPASHPTIPISTTPGYSTDSTTLAIDKYTVTNVDEFTTNVAETLKTSENNHYRPSLTLEVKSSTLPATTESEENNTNITNQTERPLWRTTKPIDKETTYTPNSKRGRVRFTATSKSGESTGASSRDNPQRTTKSSEPDGSRIDTVSDIEVRGRHNYYTEVYDKKVEPTRRTVEQIESRSSTSRSSTRNRSRQRSTTKSARTDDSGINSVIPKVLTPQYTSATEANRLSTNVIESTGKSYTSRSSSQKVDRSRKTTKAFEADDDRLNSVTPIEFTSRSGSSTEVYDKTVEPVITSTETNDWSTYFVKTTEAAYTSRTSSQDSDQPQRTTQFLEENDIRINSVTPVEFTSINDISTEIDDKTVEPTIASTETIVPSTSFVDTTESSFTSRLPAATHDHSRKTSSLDIDETTITSMTSPSDVTTYENVEYTSRLPAATHAHSRKTTSFENDDITITSITPPGDATSGKNVEYTTTTGEAGETTVNNLSSSERIDKPHLTTKSINIDDSTIALITPKESNAWTAITTEPYDTTVLHSSVTVQNDQSPNLAEITESRSFTTTLSEDTGITTETYDQTTVSLETSTNDFLTTQEEVSSIASTNDGETTVTLATTTIPWAYKQRNSTKTLEDSETETANISSNVTLTSRDVTVTGSFAPTTEVYVTDHTVVTSETGAGNTKINEQQEPTTEAIQEATTVSETKSYGRTDATEQSYSTTTPDSMIKVKLEVSTPADTTIEKIKTTTISAATTTSLSKNNRILNVTRTTIPKYDKSTYSTTDSYNSVTPVTPRDTKHTRGRVRFTNFAANTDEAGRNRRPVKQVVVRRRPANSLTNQQQINDSTEDKTRNTNLNKIKEIENAKKVANDQLAEEKRNSTKSMRRRVVVYRGRPRAESVTTTTMQSSSVSSDEVSEDIGRSRRRKWRKRIVLKRAKTDDQDDQSIAETGHIHQAVIDDSIEEDFRPLGSHITEPVSYKLVNSAEHKIKDINDGEVNIYKSSGGFLRRPGTLIRPEGINRSKTNSAGTLLTVTQATDQPAPFSKIRPVEDIKTDDQSSRAQELAVTLADPPEIRATATTGRLPFRKTTRKISTTIAPRTEAPTTSRTTPVSRRRQRPRGNSNNDKIIESIPTRPRRPAIIDYDYYVDDEVRLVLKPELKDKLYVTRKGGIRCLDQGNFAHPTSCKKFITCARMVNGQVLGTEYTCPDKLSFDPVGGICNWSAGLGCEDKPTP